MDLTSGTVAQLCGAAPSSEEPAVSLIPLAALASGSRRAPLEMLVDGLGAASARAQQLPQPITSAAKLAQQGGAHHLYVASRGATALGFIKVGRKTLFLALPAAVREGREPSARRVQMLSTARGGGGNGGGGSSGGERSSPAQNTSPSPPSPRSRLAARTADGAAPALLEVTLLCVLDFFVYERVRRSGMGRLLFEAMLSAEAHGGSRRVSGGPRLALNPARLGYDRPSPLFFGFLRRHYGLEAYVPQAYSIVVFNDCFSPDEAELIEAEAGAENEPASAAAADAIDTPAAATTASTPASARPPHLQDGATATPVAPLLFPSPAASASPLSPSVPSSLSAGGRRSFGRAGAGAAAARATPMAALLRHEATAPPLSERGRGRASPARSVGQGLEGEGGAGDGSERERSTVDVLRGLSLSGRAAMPPAAATLTATAVPAPWLPLHAGEAWRPGPSPSAASAHELEDGDSAVAAVRRAARAHGRADGGLGGVSPMKLTGRPF